MPPTASDIASKKTADEIRVSMARFAQRTSATKDQGVSVGQTRPRRTVRLEWTGENHLRHSRYFALREDKNARKVIREKRD